MRIRSDVETPSTCLHLAATFGCSLVPEYCTQLLLLHHFEVVWLLIHQNAVNDQATMTTSAAILQNQTAT
eukprot:5360364-Amphidinium_carterae.1